MILWLILLAGFVLLSVGGDLLVRGSVGAARALGVSPLIIGITLVGVGTSMPELVTCVQAVYAGAPGIAVGNVVGSNIANVLLILGFASLILPTGVGRVTLLRDGGAVMLASLLLIAVSFMMPLTRILGLIFLALLSLYLYVAWRHESRMAVANNIDHTHGAETTMRSIAGSVGVAVLGMVIVVLGGKLLVESAIGIARTYQVSEEVIGLTIVAIGTSLPELVTAVAAALRGHSDVAVGNVLGSNMFNILGIGGATAVLAPAPVEIPTQIAQADNFVMLGSVIALFVLTWHTRELGRIGGGLMFAAFCAYMYVLAAPSVSGALQ